MLAGPAVLVLAVAERDAPDLLAELLVVLERAHALHELVLAVVPALVRLGLEVSVGDVVVASDAGGSTEGGAEDGQGRGGDAEELHVEDEVELGGVVC